MTIECIIICNLEGTQCIGTENKEKGLLPDGWAIIQGKKRIDLCPPCLKHVKQQLANQENEKGFQV